MRNTIFAFILLSMSLLLASCTNTGSVNIMITNTGAGDCNDVPVAVAMTEVNSHLVMNEGDTLFLLNETNQRVDFKMNDTGDSLMFVVPVVRQNSQKNYSLNAHKKSLSDNLFRFRTANIEVHVGK